MSTEEKRSEEQIAKHLNDLSDWNGGRQAILAQHAEVSGVHGYERNRSNMTQQDVMQEPLEAIDASEFGAAVVAQGNDIYISGLDAMVNNISFPAQIARMNQMYELPYFTVPTEVTSDYFYLRMQQFQRTLGAEFEELQDIRDTDYTHPMDALTDLADLLGDIVVYCHSEAARFGIPLDKVLNIIMESNFSKLGADGKPMKDENDKVLKGPNYWKPEPKIRELLNELSTPG